MNERTKQWSERLGEPVSDADADLLTMNAFIVEDIPMDELIECYRAVPNWLRIQPDDPCMEYLLNHLRIPGPLNFYEHLLVFPPAVFRCLMDEAGTDDEDRTRKYLVYLAMWFGGLQSGKLETTVEQLSEWTMAMKVSVLMADLERKGQQTVGGAGVGDFGGNGSIFILPSRRQLLIMAVATKNEEDRNGLLESSRSLARGKDSEGESTPPTEEGWDV